MPVRWEPDVPIRVQLHFARTLSSTTSSTTSSTHRHDSRDGARQMTRNRTSTRTQSLGQVGLRPATPAAKGHDAWVLRAASEHPFDLGTSVPLCATEDPDLFWPATEAQSEQAIAVCRACPLAEACLTVARQRLEWGVWGGQLLARGRPTAELPGNVRPSARDTARSAGHRDSARDIDTEDVCRVVGAVARFTRDATSRHTTTPQGSSDPSARPRRPGDRPGTTRG